MGNLTHFWLGVWNYGGTYLRVLLNVMLHVRRCFWPRLGLRAGMADLGFAGAVHLVDRTFLARKERRRKELLRRGGGLKERALLFEGRDRSVPMVGG